MNDYKLCSLDELLGFRFENLSIEKQFNKVNYEIFDCLKTDNSNKFRIAKLLFIFNECRLYKLTDFKNVYDYAFVNFGLQRTSVKNCLNVVYQFCDPVTLKVLPWFSDFTFYKLVLMINFSTSELKRLGIDPLMSCREIKKILDDYKKELRLEYPIPEQPTEQIFEIPIQCVVNDGRKSYLYGDNKEPCGRVTLGSYIGNYIEDNFFKRDCKLIVKFVTIGQTSDH